jgi:hypothetical protein
VFCRTGRARIVRCEPSPELAALVVAQHQPRIRACARPLEHEGQIVAVGQNIGQSPWFEVHPVAVRHESDGCKRVARFVGPILGRCVFFETVRCRIFRTCREFRVVALDRAARTELPTSQNDERSYTAATAACSSPRTRNRRVRPKALVRLRRRDRRSSSMAVAS